MPKEHNPITISTTTRIDPLSAIADRASAFVAQSKAANTIRAYKSDWAHFTVWCQAHGQAVLPALPETVVLYVSDLAATHKPGTLTRRLSAIKVTHDGAGLESPTIGARVLQVMAGIRRNKGTMQSAKTPVTVEDLRRMIGLSPRTLVGARDRVLLLVGFSGAFRRSELVSLDLEAVQFVREGMIVTLRRSKTDQDGTSRKTGIPYGLNAETCPVLSLQEWIDQSKISTGPLFRPIGRYGKLSTKRLTGNAVATIVKKYAKEVGLDAKTFSGHSLRSGLATAAAAAGASERSIMNQTRHNSVAMLRRYIRDGSLFRENAAGVVGL
jgi:site-specific recombinase XerD